MDFRRKSALTAKFFSLAVLLALTACGDDGLDLPHVFTGNEVPPEVLAEPRAVATPTGPVDQTWQRLGDVPDKPKDFTSQPLIDASKQQLQNDRSQAQQLKQTYENQ